VVVGGGEAHLMLERFCGFWDNSDRGYEGGTIMRIGPGKGTREERIWDIQDYRPWGSVFWF